LLDLNDTQVTNAGVKVIKKRFPGIIILHGC